MHCSVVQKCFRISGLGDGVDSKLLEVENAVAGREDGFRELCGATQQVQQALKGSCMIDAWSVKVHDSRGEGGDLVLFGWSPVSGEGGKCMRTFHDTVEVLAGDSKIKNSPTFSFAGLSRPRTMHCPLWGCPGSFHKLFGSFRLWVGTREERSAVCMAHENLQCQDT